MELKKIFTPSRIELIEFLIDNKDQSFNKAELIEKSNISQKSVNEIIPELLENKLIIIIERTEKSKAYQININSFTVQALMDAKKDIESLGEKQ